MATLGIYISVPFCKAKCTYCNFPADVYPHVERDDYLQALEGEILDAAHLYPLSGIDPVVLKLPVDSIYIGGGTPSLFDPVVIRRILACLRQRFGVCDDCETTLEIDPETVTPLKAREWLAAGVNRASLGVQSFQDRELKAVGRMHRRDDIERAVAGLRQAGLRNLSFDLIAGLPYQSFESWEQSLAETERLAPEHISIYMLEIDDHSRLGREYLTGGKRYSAPALPEPDRLADYYEAAVGRLAARGYHHYEISNFARPGCESRHNLKYWNRQPHLGFGAGAHSFDRLRRWANVTEPAEYLRRIRSGNSPLESLTPVSDREAQEEFFFLGLRKVDGIELNPPGIALDREFRERVDRLVQLGLLIAEQGRVRLSPHALVVSNDIFAEFVG